MLAGWGSSCGQCSPAAVAPKTLFMKAGDAAALVKAPSGGLVLGWLVIVRTPDTRLANALIEIDSDLVVLSRDSTAAVPPTSGRMVGVKDEYMSANHAMVRRPPAGQPAGHFTIRDREAPGPSANGTFVNDRKLAPGETVQLSDGDVILTGTTEMVVKTLLLPPPTS